MKSTALRSTAGITLLLAYFSSAVGAVFLNGALQSFCLALLLFFLAVGCGAIVHRSFESGHALGSINGALQISRQTQPTLFWLTCASFSAGGLVALVFSAYGIFRVLSLTSG
jgi:hypothetical protein